MPLVINNSTIEQYFKERSVEQWILCYMRIEQDICDRNGITDIADGKWVLQQLERMYQAGGVRSVSSGIVSWSLYGFGGIAQQLLRAVGQRWKGRQSSKTDINGHTTTRQ